MARSSLRDRRPVWLTAPVLTVAVLSIAAGMAQFSVTAVIGDVAATFGEVTDGDDPAAQIGLPTTTIGLALAVIRLASLASLPVASLADRFGRRRLLLTAMTVGLTLTVGGALAPGFWWYVALVSLSRPALSAVNALATVVAAEEATSRDRSAAVALIAAAYGLGSGIVSVSRALLPGEPSFRVVTAFALVPLLLLPLLARKVREPQIAQRAEYPGGLPGKVPAWLRRRVFILSLMAAGIAIATGPGFTFLFVYGEGVLGASPETLATFVLAAGPTGLAGLLAGRAAADRLGRRGTALTAMALTGLAVAVGYSGDIAQLGVGYLGSIFAASALAPAIGSLSAELVPTKVRATVAGWMTVAGVLGAVLGLLTFGWLADLTGSFGAAALGLGLTVVVLSLGYLLLPETRGLELDTIPGAPEAAQE